MSAIRAAAAALLFAATTFGCVAASPSTLPSVTSHSVIVTGPVCEEDAAIVGFGEYTAGFGYEYYKCIPMDDLPLPEWAP